MSLHRRTQAARAVYRDGALCVFCYFRDQKKVKGQEVHHVYGRGREVGDWQEDYHNLVSTCRRHHPPPIKTPGANPDLEYVEQIRKQANDTPINKEFEHE